VLWLIGVKEYRGLSAQLEPHDLDRILMADNHDVALGVAVIQLPEGLHHAVGELVEGLVGERQVPRPAQIRLQFTGSEGWQVIPGQSLPRVGQSPLGKPLVYPDRQLVGGGYGGARLERTLQR